MKCLDESNSDDKKTSSNSQQPQANSPHVVENNQSKRTSQSNLNKPVPAVRSAYTTTPSNPFTTTQNDTARPVAKPRPSVTSTLSTIQTHDGQLQNGSKSSRDSEMVRPLNEQVQDVISIIKEANGNRTRAVGQKDLLNKQRIPEIYKEHEQQSRFLGSDRNSTVSQLESTMANQISLSQQNTQNTHRQEKKSESENWRAVEPSSISPKPKITSMMKFSDNEISRVNSDQVQYEGFSLHCRDTASSGKVTPREKPEVRENSPTANILEETVKHGTSQKGKWKPQRKPQIPPLETNKEPVEKKRRMQYQGQVVSVIRKNDGKTPFGFIRCEELLNSGVIEKSENDKQNDIFFSFDDVQSNQLDLKKDDDVEFRIFISKRTGQKPKAANVMVLQLANRTLQELLDYVNKVQTMLSPNEEIRLHEDWDNLLLDSPHYGDQQEVRKEKEYDPKEIMKLLTSPVLWQCVAKQVAHFSNSEPLLEKFIEVLTLLHEKIRTSEERFRQVLINVTGEAKFFNPVRGRFRSYMNGISQRFHEKRESIQKFLLLVAKLLPEKQSAILAFIKPLMEHPDGETAKFLYQILKSLTSATNSSIEDLDWKDLPLILKKEEIFNAGMS